MNFGFSRRNAFIQPQVDNVLLQGLKQYETTNVLFSVNCLILAKMPTGVTLNIQNKDGEARKNSSAVFDCM